MTTPEQQHTQAFAAFVSDYLEDDYRFHPSLAAFVGVHRYDQELEDYRAEALETERENLRSHLQRLNHIDPANLSRSDRIDHQIVANNIHARLFDLEVLHTHCTNPQIYGEAISHAFLRQALFEFAPKEVRLANIIAKQQKFPALLATAKANLTNPAAVLVDVGINTFQGALSLIGNDLPAIFKAVGNQQQRAAYQQSTEQAVAAIRDFLHFLDHDLRTRAHGNFALGENNFQTRLRYEEGVEQPLTELLALAEAELAHTQAIFIETARQIDNSQPPMETWRKIQQQHPPAGQLVNAAQQQLETILQFINERKLVSWPAAPPAQVASTPDFYRWSFASMVTPGPLEECQLPSRYFITDVDPGWPADQQAAHLTYFSEPILWAISVHEVYPGHYAQFTHLSKVASKVRQNAAFMPITYSEGWAHYAEQMMFEEGFLADQPGLRIGQLWEALLRLCRFVVSIKLHTGEFTVDQATQFFVDNAYAEPVPSRVEAERGCFDPMYLSYSLGKLQILKLRDDYRQAQGSNYSLAQFHHQLLSEGMAPIAYHRQLMLPTLD